MIGVLLESASALHQETSGSLADFLARWCDGEAGAGPVFRGGSAERAAECAEQCAEDEREECHEEGGAEVIIPEELIECLVAAAVPVADHAGVLEGIGAHGIPEQQHDDDQADDRESRADRRGEQRCECPILDRAASSPADESRQAEGNRQADGEEDRGDRPRSVVQRAIVRGEVARQIEGDPEDTEGRAAA